MIGSVVVASLYGVQLSLSSNYRVSFSNRESLLGHIHGVKNGRGCLSPLGHKFSSSFTPFDSLSTSKVLTEGEGTGMWWVRFRDITTVVSVGTGLEGVEVSGTSGVWRGG